MKPIHRIVLTAFLIFALGATALLAAASRGAVRDPKSAATLATEKGSSVHRQVPASAPAALQQRPQAAQGPDQERWYFEKWHQQYGAVLPIDVTQAAWREISRLPGDEGGRSVNSWTALGPFGMNSVFNQGTLYSGRMLNFDYRDGWFLVASASGGLWEPFINFRFPLSDAITSLAIGAVAEKPGTNGSFILIGTGEPYQRGGTGLWLTTDGGGTWSNLNMTPYSPNGFYKIAFTPDNPNIVHAATTSGYYRSSDGGYSWNLVLAGNCSDVAASLNQLGIVYVAMWGDGLYESTNGGLTFAKVTTGGIPTTNVGRTAISLAVNPSYVWISMARNDNNQALGVFHTTSAGTTWINASPPGDYLWGQGWYANTIAASPNLTSLVLVGGGDLWRTTDAGATWTEIHNPNVHVDQHCILWTDQNTVQVGNDGGLSYSDDQGVNWYTFGNTYPITQYVNFDVGVNNAGVMFGGSQDNGFSGTTNGGQSWNFTFGGDGGGISIDPNDSSRIWGTLGVYGGDWAFRRHRSYDTGQTWDNSINNGIAPSSQWYTKIRNDQVAPVYLYTNSGPYVYKSVDDGTDWTALNDPFPASLYNLNVGAYDSGYSVIYASLSPDQPYAGRQLRVYDNGTWYERSTGFPTSVWVRGVAVNPTNDNIGYALMTGFVAGQKIFKTTDRGVTWTNISGDVPNVPMGDLIPNPTNDNILYLGTEFGCFRTTNGGVNWQRWNNGMPEAAIVTEMRAIDRRNIDGTYYAVASTYGRGIWSREISGDDPSAVAGPAPGPAAAAKLGNVPNPFGRETSIRFALPARGYVDLRIYDAAGRQVAKLVDGEMEAGTHAVSFDGAALAPGVYFSRLRGNGLDERRKMVIAK